MSQFNGAQPGYKGTGRAKGVMRNRKAQKRLEAEVRDELLAPDDPKRRAVRLATLPEPDVTTRKRHRTRKNPVLMVCIGCNVVQGEPHEDYCPVITGTLSSLPEITDQI